MKLITLVGKSMIYYRRTYLSVAMGAALATAIIVGAMIVGDSVRGSLQRLAILRLGHSHFALTASDRFFRGQLADELAKPLATPVAPILQLPGIAIAAGGNNRVNAIQVLGVDQRFWDMALAPVNAGPLAADQAYLNRNLAERLGLQAGSELLVRVQKTGFLPGEAPLASNDALSVALRLKITAIVDDRQMGRFSLRTSQISPPSIFLSLPFLAERTGLNRRANILLVGQNASGTLTSERLQHQLTKCWTLADAGLKLASLPQIRTIELTSDRIFLAAPVVEAAGAADPHSYGVFSYLVNELRAGARAAPYSFVAASGPPLVPPEMKDNEIIINRWLAQDLGIDVGAHFQMRYYVLGPLRQLQERTETFQVRQVVPVTNDRTLMPAFPGLTDIENCRDWNTSLPIDLGRIRPKDESYWDKYRGTPKAFVTLAAAQRMWQNRFGRLTAIRYPGNAIADLRAKITDSLPPAALGLDFFPIRRQALQAGGQAVDFGQLFLGLSFFIIVAAILLMALLFAFTIENRSRETATLLALGFLPATLQRMAMVEGGIIAIIGGAVGIAGGVGYSWAVIYALNTLWQGAVHTSALQLTVAWPSLVVGYLSAVIAALIAIWLVARRQSRTAIHQLHSQRSLLIAPSTKKIWSSAVLALAAIATAVVIVVRAAPGTGREAAGAFFAAGALMLIGTLAAANLLWFRLVRPAKLAKISLPRLAINNCARKNKQSLAVIGLLACGIFLVVAVAANQHTPQGLDLSRSSGTGGFSLYGEASLPILQRLGEGKGRQNMALDPADLAGTHLVYLRVHAGDDASCLNLNRVQRPPVAFRKPPSLCQALHRSRRRLQGGPAKSLGNT